MSKNIWIINDYAGSPKHGMTFRHYYLAKGFVKAGNHSTIITASYSHFLKKRPEMQGQKYKLENIDNIDYVWINVVKYSKSFDKKRVFKWFQFSYRLFFISSYLKNKPDVIICSSTAPFSIVPAYFLAKKFNAKLVFEVRDIWPLTLVQIGGISKYHPLIILMGWFEKFALKKSDIIVSNLQNYTDHIQKIGIMRFAHWISNGIDLDEMDQIEPLLDKVKNQIPSDKFIVGYTGKLGVSNAINYLIDVAKQLVENQNIVFVIVGDGQEVNALKQQAIGLPNVLFIDPIPKMQIQSMLALFDVCYIGWKKEELYKFGISANKLYDYMYSGKPILHSTYTANDVVISAHCGVSVEAENVSSGVDGIMQLYTTSEDNRKGMGKNGRDYIIEKFSYQQLAKRYLMILNKVRK